MATPLHKNPCPEGHEIYNTRRPLVGHHYFTLSLYGPCTGLEKRYFKKYINKPPLGVGVLKFTTFCLLTLQILHTILGSDWPRSS